jgi:hypothetical protein
MGKTVESYRIALESEISRWSGFVRALRKHDREAFEQMIDVCHSYASTGSSATNPILFELFIMSILLAQQKRILALEKKLGIKNQVAGILELDKTQENQRIGCKIQKRAPLDSKLRHDLLFTFEDKKIAVEVKRYLNSRNATFLLKRLGQLATTKSYKILLITNSRPSPDIVQLFLSRNVTLIERTTLKKIIERNETLLNYIK